jgi:hypothetical protein
MQFFGSQTQGPAQLKAEISPLPIRILIGKMKTKVSGVSAVPIFTKPQTKANLAEALEVSMRFLEGEVRTGRLRGIIIGGRTIRFLPRDIEAWLNARPTIAKEEVS